MLIDFNGRAAIKIRPPLLVGAADSVSAQQKSVHGDSFEEVKAGKEERRKGNQA